MVACARNSVLLRDFRSDGNKNDVFFFMVLCASLCFMLLTGDGSPRWGKVRSFSWLSFNARASKVGNIWPRVISKVARKEIA